MDFLKIAFFVWTGLIFASQAAIISVSIYFKRIGAIPELLYLATCVFSAIPFVLCFIVKLRGLPWSFKWGIFSPLACTQALGICTVAYFPATASREVEELRYRMPYLVVCFSLALLNVLLTLLGAVVYHSCRAARLRWHQRPERPTMNIQLQMLGHPSTTTSNGQIHLDPPPPCALCRMPQPSTPLYSFDEEAQLPRNVYALPPTHSQTGVRPSRNKLNLTIHTNINTPRAAAYLILSPLEPGAPLETERDTETNTLGGSIRGEADRKFVAESSPKKHVRIGRGRDLV